MSSSFSHEIAPLPAWAVVSAGDDTWWVMDGPFRRSPLAPADGPALWRVPFFLREYLESGALPWQVPARCERVDARGLGDWVAGREEAAAVALRRSPAARAGEGVAWLPADADSFRTGFDALSPLLAGGELAKGVVLTRARTAPGAVSSACVRRWLHAALISLPAIESATGVSTYAFADEHGNGFVGATPELLFECVHRGVLRSAALAVTRIAAPGASPTAEFSSARERSEHDLVLEHLLARLGRFGTVTTGARRPRRFGALCHLETPVSVRIAAEAIPAQELIRELHPTPALGTSPSPDESATAHRWLHAHASLRGERAEFGAPFGVWDTRDGGRGRILVAIRQVRFSVAEGRFDIPAGCGIVRGSRLRDEWEEALAKVNAVRDLFLPQAGSGATAVDRIGAVGGLADANG